MKIRTRIFLTILLAVGFGFYRLSVWVLDDLRPRYLETMEETMVDVSAVLASIVEEQLAANTFSTNGLRAAFDLADKRALSAKIYQVCKTNVQLRVYIVDEKGIVTFDSEGGLEEGKDHSKWNNVIRTMRGEYGARATRIIEDDPASVILHVSSPIKRDGKTAGVLTVCKPASSVSKFVDASKQKIVSAGLIAGFVVIVLVLIVSIWVTWPIKRLTEYARQVRDGRKIKAPEFGRSDIGELGRAFEQMRDALEGREYVENYVQTMTHEMKSPLSAIRGAAELLKEEMPPDRRDKFIANICEESARMQDLIDRLLQLAAVEKKKALDKAEDVDLCGLVSDVVKSMSPVLAGKGIVVDVECRAAVTKKCERFLMRQSLHNLLQNAVDFSPEKSTIIIRVTESDGKVSITVEDDGSGIPDYALSRVFDRFYSLDRPGTGKKGTGLGLTFVREVMALHGGSVTIANRPGGGTTATMMF